MSSSLCPGSELREVGARLHAEAGPLGNRDDANSAPRRTITPVTKN